MIKQTASNNPELVNEDLRIMVLMTEHTGFWVTTALAVRGSTLGEGSQRWRRAQDTTKSIAKSLQ